MNGEETIVVIAKEPVAGAVKRRLAPPCTSQQSADLAMAMLIDTLCVVAETPARRRLLVLSGAVGDWLPDGFDVVPQVKGTLDVRLAGAMRAVDGPMIVIAMDTPQITPDLLRCDFETHSAWLGPTDDGGYWALGLAEPDPAMVEGVPMSVPYTLAAQRQRLLDAGHSVGELSQLCDVDTWDDALEVAAAAPHTRFGRAMAAIRSQAMSDARRSGQ